MCAKPLHFGLQCVFQSLVQVWIIISFLKIDNIKQDTTLITVSAEYALHALEYYLLQNSIADVYSFWWNHRKELLQLLQSRFDILPGHVYMNLVYSVKGLQWTENYVWPQIRFVFFFYFILRK